MRRSVAVLMVAFALSSVPARALDERKLDKTAKVEGGVAAVSGNIGAFEILKVELKKLPNANDAAKAKPDKICHPDVAVAFENKGNVSLTARFVWWLVDESGAQLGSCKDDTTVSPRSEPDDKTCSVMDLKCFDVPRIRSVRLVTTTEDAEVTLDGAYPFSDTIAEVNAKVGDIVVEKVYVDGAPKKKDIERGTADPTDKVHPYVNLLLSNPSDSKVAVSMRVVLVDAAGTVYATCDGAAKVKAHVKGNDYTVCHPVVPTGDWPKVTTAQVTVAIK